MKFKFFRSGVFVMCIGGLVSTSCQKQQPLFTELNDKETGITFSNTITETEELNINQYLYAHNGGGVAVGDINNDGLPDIYFTANQLPNKLYVNKGSFQFEDITEKAGVACAQESGWKTGVVMVDVNSDGLLDIYVSQVCNYRSFYGSNQLFINNGDLTFTERAKEYGLDLKSYSQHAAFFDYDLDGDLDMYQLNQAVHNPDVYIRAELRSNRDSLAGDRLMRNDNGKFVDVSQQAGIYGGATGYGLAVGIGDIDNNGCPDIYISNDFHENDYVYYNNCNGTFREDIKGTLGHCSTFSMGNDIADFNNDGWLDILTLDMKPDNEVIRKKSAGPDPYDIYNYKLGFGYFYQFPRNMLQLNRGNLFGNSVQFSEVGQLAGVDATDWSWSGLMADLDNDGWKDIFITNGIIRRPIDLDYINFTYNDEAQTNLSSLELAYKMPDGAVSNFAFRNKKDLTFENVSQTWGFEEPGYSMGTAYGDFDDDGDLDLVVNNLNAKASIYRNNTESVTENNYIKIKLEGNKGNAFGIGARVSIDTGEDNVNQELNPSRGWLSSVDYTLTFGIGKSTLAKSIIVEWSDGSQQILTDIPANKTIVIRQREATKHTHKPPSRTKPFIDATVKSGVTFHHMEDNYVDFNDERLMPHKLSTEGPKIAVADVNNDGLDDFFVGGAAGQAGVLNMQRRGDSSYFQQHAVPAFELDKNQEDVEPVFLDADGDGDQDLFVVSGMSRVDVTNEHRLYINDGKGNFSKPQKALPSIRSNGSCVVAADFNNDGHTDLFLGSRSVTGGYGLSPDSYLLWNNGNGTFLSDTSSNMLALRALGMVTDAVWLAKTKELVVVGEWMPLTILNFSEVKISKQVVPNSTGWWNTISVADIDGNGEDDLLAGNIGLNTDMKASDKEPVSLYIDDYDNNAATDPILTYFRQQKEWTYAGMDDIKKQLPSIRTRYATYSQFASHTFREVFPEATTKNCLVKRAQVFKSAYFIRGNDGAFAIHDFPLEIQFSPVYTFLPYDFNRDGFLDVLALGNFYGSSPAIGKFDASYGVYLLNNGKGNFSSLSPSESGFAVYGESRDMKLVQAGDAKWIIVSRNNSPMRVLEVR